MDTANIYGHNAVSAALIQKRPDLVYCVVAVGRLYTALVARRLMTFSSHFYYFFK